MLPCGNPRSSPAAAPQQPRSSPCIAAHSAGAGGGGAVTCGGDRRLRSRGARRASRARARTCISPAPDSGGPTTYSALPMAVSVIYTAHSTAPLPLTSTPQPAPLDLTPASTVTRPAAPHTPPGPLAYGAGDGRGTAEEPYMCCTHHVYDAASINLRRDRHISRRARQRLDTTVHSPQTAAFPTIQPLPLP
jgi:hypothetical protein